MHHRSLLLTSSLICGLLLALPSGAGQPTPRRADVERAIEAQRALLSTRQADPLAWNDLGNLLDLGADPEGAETAYRRALELQPNLVSAHYNLALLLHSGGRLREALEEFQHVVAVASDHAWSYYEMGRIHQQLGERNAALKAYAQAFAIDPRLSLPDVNPYVLDNPLLTQALMKAASVEVRQDWAPRTYEDASRIADLLVAPKTAAASPMSESPPPAEEQAPLATEPPSEVPPSMPASTVANPPSAPAPREVGPEPPSLPAPGGDAQGVEPPPSERTSPSPRHLTPESLGSGEVGNQATPEVESTPTGGVRSRTVTPSRAPAPTVRETPQPSPSPSTQRPTSPRPRFVPGARSSAQLERRLRPAAGAP